MIEEGLNKLDAGSVIVGVYSAAGALGAPLTISAATSTRRLRPSSILASSRAQRRMRS
jgi:hypothetical protein